jgi:hypothetical protein
LTCAQPATAGTNVQVQAGWDKLTKDPAFSYKDKKELVQKPKKQRTDIFEKLLNALATFFTGRVGRAIGWVLFFILTGWALYMLFVNESTSLFSRRSRVRNRDQLTAEEELEHADWPKLLQEAIDNKDARMVIRYSFMQVLQLMQQRELILYRNDKTNYEYYSELKDAQLKPHFRFLSRQYEYAWYGHYQLSPAIYDEYMQTFDSLKNKLSIR